MTFPRITSVAIRFVAASLIGLAAPAALAQGPFPDAPSAPAAAAAITVSSTPAAPDRSQYEHKFWDKENLALFVATGALSGADFAVTRSNLQSGGQELNPVVRMFGRSTAGLAVNFAGETAGVITLSYFLHRIGHHKLERALSMVDIAGSAGAVSYGLANR
jgi:hypothetical protein